MRSSSPHVANHSLGVVVALNCAVGLLGLACAQAPSAPWAAPAVQAKGPAAERTVLAAEHEERVDDAGDPSAEESAAKPEAKAETKPKFRSTFYTTDAHGSPLSAVVVDEQGNARVKQFSPREAASPGRLTHGGALCTGESMDRIQPGPRPGLKRDKTSWG